MITVAQFEKKVESLKKHHEELSSGHTINIHQASQHPSSSIPLQNRHLQLRKLHLENIHRLTGITAFQVPNIDGFGIRIEMFNKVKFEAPHYIILRKNSKGTLDIYRHTIPVYIPLRKYKAKYLSTNIQLFVRKVRHDLVQHARKKQVFMEPLPNVRRVEVDDAIRLIKMQLVNDQTIHLLCDNDIITSVVSDESPELESLLVGSVSGLKDRLALVTL